MLSAARQWIGQGPSHRVTVENLEVIEYEQFYNEVGIERTVVHLRKIGDGFSCRFCPRGGTPLTTTGPIEYATKSLDSGLRSAVTTLFGPKKYHDDLEIAMIVASPKVEVVRS